jgi:hypothetical protein
VELFFASLAEPGDRSSLGFDTGAVYLLARHIALDGAVGTTLTGCGPDYVMHAGLSVLFRRGP